MKTLLLAASTILGLAGAAHAQRESPITGKGLIDLCQATDRTRTEACDAYISGIADSVAFYQRQRPRDGSKGGVLPAYICVPNTTTGVQLRQSVIDWFKKRPERGTQQASVIVLNALNDTYLCPGENKPAEPAK